MVLCGAWLAGAALASGTASPPPPPPPAVDFSTLPASASARGPEHGGNPHPVLARLVADADRVPPGESVRIGIHLTQDPDWHTYWKSPGDIGKPTEVAWSVPPGTAASALSFPVPQRFEQDGMVSFGYDREVLLSAVLDVPADAASGAAVLGADVDWLVCKTSCIPGRVHLELPIEIGSGRRALPYGPLFDHYAEQHPVPVSDAPLTVETVLSTTAVRADETFRAAFLVKSTGEPFAELPSSAWPTFTPIAASGSFGPPTGSIEPSVVVKRLDDGTIAAVVDSVAYPMDPLPTDDAIGGLLQLKVGDRWVRTELHAPLRWAGPDDAVSLVEHPVFAAVVSGGQEAAEPAPSEATVVPAAAAPVGAASTGATALLGVLLFAFVGGLVLNVMPCVLPVLTLKLYGLVEQREMGAAARRTTGLAYSLGVLSSFWALAAAVLVARIVFGVQLDWGSQFQYPAYVAGLATIVFAFGLSLLGVFEIPVFGAETADRAAEREGPVGSFFTGVFATLLATPCSAPFLGTAVAYAFGAPPLQLFAVMTTIGAGLAAPFLLIAFVPALYRFLPRPGEWMETLKQVLGFTLILTTIWLGDVLMAQIGERITSFWLYLCAVAVGCWVFGRFGGVAASHVRQLVAASVGLAIATAGGFAFLDLQFAEPECGPEAVEVGTLDYGEHIPWVPFSEPTLSMLSGRPVFVDFTADWCITCKANERTVLERSDVREAMKTLGVVPLKADWTRADPVITEWLRKNGRAGVPMYLVIPGDRTRAPILLPEVITPGMVIEALRTASG